MKPHESDNNIVKENNKNEEKALLVNNEQHLPNANLDETQSSKQSEFSLRRLGDLKMSEKIKLTAFMIIAMAVLRIFSFDIFVMIGELLTSIIVYLFSIWNNKCMAILTGINGIAGLLFSFIQIFKSLNDARKEKFGYISTINVIVSIFSTFVYAIVCYLSYYGFRHFDLLRFGKHEDRHLDKEKEKENETSQYGAMEKDLNSSVREGDKNKNEEHKNIEGEQKGKEDFIGQIGENAKAAGEKLTQLKDGVAQVGDMLNKLGK